MSEGVGKACIEQVGELCTFLICKSCVVAIGFGVLDVYLLVRHIHITTDKYGLLLIEPLEVEAESVVPRHALVKAFEPIL